MALLDILPRHQAPVIHPVLPPEGSVMGFDRVREARVFPLTKVTGERLASFVRKYGEKILRSADVEVDDPKRVVGMTAEVLVDIGIHASDTQETKRVAVGTFTKTEVPHYVTETLAEAKQRLDNYEETHTLTGTPAVLTQQAIEMAAHDLRLDPYTRACAELMVHQIVDQTQDGRSNTIELL